jgi:hypothetical protein
MSIGDMNYASAISEGNSLSRSVAEHNEGIRQNNQLLIQQWNAQNRADQQKAEKDKDIKGVEDAYGGFTAMGTIAQGYQRVRQLGVGGAISEDVTNIKTNAQNIADTLRGGISKMTTKIPAQQVQAQAESEGSRSVSQSGTAETTAQPESTPSSDVEKTATSVGDDSEDVASTISKGLKTAGKVTQVAGAIGGVVSAVDGISDMTDGKFARMDTAHKTGDALSTVGGLLDIASIFLPVLAPIGAVVSTAGAVTNTINTIQDDKKRENTDASSEQNQLNQNKQSIEVSPSFTSMSLIGSAQHSVIHSIAGSGSF